MLSILFFITLCGKFSFATFLEIFFKQIESGPLLPCNTLSLAEQKIFIRDEQNVGPLEAEEICAKECYSAPYFCHSFILAYEEASLNCYTFATGSPDIIYHMKEFNEDPQEEFDPQEEVDPQKEFNENPKCLFRSLYDLDNESDFVVSVAEISHDYVNLDRYEWNNKLIDNFKTPDDNLNEITSLLILESWHAIGTSIRTTTWLTDQPNSLSDYLDRTSLIFLLRSWSFPNPQFSTYFDRLVLMFLRRIFTERVSYSSESYYYMAHNSFPPRDVRAFVHSFGSGHYVTITRSFNEYDQITYISADGDFGEVNNRANAAVSVFLKCSDRQHGYTPGTTKIHQAQIEKGILIKRLNLNRNYLSKPAREQRAAIAVVDRFLCATSRTPPPHLAWSTISPQLIREMITFVLSFAFKVRQSDFNSIDEIRIRT